MLLVSYDISDTKVRTKLAKFLNKFGRKLQYSVYGLRNSRRVLRNIQDEIELRYKKGLGGGDSVFIAPLCEACKSKITRYGYARNDEKEVVIFQ